MRRTAIFPLIFASALCLAQTPTTSGPGPASPNFSGMYSFLREGEFLQLDVEEQGMVSGFISRYGDADSDRGAFLDHMFKDASLRGHKLKFATREVHGVHYEFEGNIQRGPGKDPGAEAYWVIRGKLTEFTTDADKKTSARSREAEFKSLPLDTAAPDKED